MLGLLMCRFFFFCGSSLWTIVDARLRSSDDACVTIFQIQQDVLHTRPTQSSPSRHQGPLRRWCAVTWKPARFRWFFTEHHAAGSLMLLLRCQGAQACDPDNCRRAWRTLALLKALRLPSRPIACPRKPNHHACTTRNMRNGWTPKTPPRASPNRLGGQQRVVFLSSSLPADRDYAARTLRASWNCSRPMARFYGGEPHKPSCPCHHSQPEPHHAVHIAAPGAEFTCGALWQYAWLQRCCT